MWRCRCFGGRHVQGDERNDEDQVARNDEIEDQIAINQQLGEGQLSAINFEDGARKKAITFTYPDIRNATNTFKAGPLVGVGRFGPAYKGKLETTNREIMVKKINHSGSREEFQAEIEKLWLLRHPNIVELIGYHAGKELRLVVYEFMPLRSLESHLHGAKSGRRGLNWDKRMKIAGGVAKGLSFLHSEGYVLGCLSSSHILLDLGFHPKFCDLGLVKLDDKRSEAQGLTSARAPEYAATGKPTTSSDVYGFGVFMLELISARNPLAITDKNGIIDKARGWLNEESESLLGVVDVDMERDFSVGVLSKAVELALKCVEDDPKYRPKLNDVVEVLYLTKY